MASAPNLLARIAQAYMERERQRVGIPQEQRDAREAETVDLLRRAQAARAMQQYDLAPAEQESQIGLRTAQAESARALASARETPKAGTPHYETDAAGNVTMFTPQPDGTIKKESLGRHGKPQQEPRPDRVLVQTWTGQFDAAGNPIMQFTPRPEMAGQTAPAPPTTAQRNVNAGVSAPQQAIAQAQKRATPVLQDLGTRITDINAGSEGGFMARVGGMVRSGAAKAGLDSAADLYRTGVRGFVPLFARSVGHVGVLTELDVQRTEELFPRIGDSAAVTQEKLARVQRIMTGQEPLPFQWSQPSYDDAGITEPEPGPGTPPALPGAGGGVSPNVQRILDMLKERSAGPR